MVVDVGEGVGHEIQAIRSILYRPTGRFILQDLPDTVASDTSVTDFRQEACATGTTSA